MSKIGPRWLDQFNTGTSEKTTPHRQDRLLLDNSEASYVKKYAQLWNLRKTIVATLVDAVTIAVDASLGNDFKVTLGGNRTLGNPTNGYDGQKILIKVQQDVTGNRTLAYDTKYRFSTDLPSPTITVTASHFDLLGFRYDSTDDNWDLIALVQNYDNS